MAHKISSMMLKKPLVFVFLLVFTGSLSSYAQHIAINNNLLFDLMGTFSAGVEIPLPGNNTFEVYASIRPWKRGVEEVL